MTLKPIAERLALELSLPIFTTYICRGCDSNTQPAACGVNALTNCTIAAVDTLILYNYMSTKLVCILILIIKLYVNNNIIMLHIDIIYLA